MLLVQLPPDMERDDARLDYFLGALPGWVRVAVELRHSTWQHEDVFGLLERHGAAYCVMSGAKLPCLLRATADLVYVRLHGPDHDALYAGSYSDDGPALVGRPDPGVGARRARGLRLLQQRRRRPRRAQRPHAAVAARRLTHAGLSWRSSWFS